MLNTYKLKLHIIRKLRKFAIYGKKLQTVRILSRFGPFFSICHPTNCFPPVCLVTFNLKHLKHLLFYYIGHWASSLWYIVSSNLLVSKFLWVIKITWSWLWKREEIFMNLWALHTESYTKNTSGCEKERPLKYNVPPKHLNKLQCAPLNKINFQSA